MRNVPGLLVLFVCVAACGSSQSAGTSAAEAQLGASEKKVATLEERIAALEAQAITDHQTLELILDALSALNSTVTELKGREPTPRAARGRPNPATVYSVPIDGNPFVGPADAPVTIVEGSEFACPFCFRVRSTLEELRKIYGEDLRIVYKNFIVHPQQATIPALAACAAHKQGRYKKMRDNIWGGFENGRKLARKDMERFARRAKLKMRAFRRDMDGEECAAKVRQDQAELSRVGVRGTPAFYINGRFLSGARPIDQFKTLIDEELAVAKKKIAAGMPAAEYYQSLVDSGQSELAPL